MTWPGSEPIGLVIFPPACPGCQDYDPRQHDEVWCADCRPENGSPHRPPTGDADRQVTVPDLGTGGSGTDGANQRAAGALWGTRV